MKRAHVSVAMLTLLSAIAACGGGGSSNPDAPISTQHDAPVTVDGPITTIDAAHTDSGVGIDSALVDSGTVIDSTTTIDGSTTIDGGTGVDATPVTCTTTVIGAQDILLDDAANGFIAWGGPVTTVLGDGGAANFQLEFFDMIEPDLTASLDLSMGNQNNYSTCAACVRVRSRDATNTVVREYFQSGGTMKLSEDPFTNKNMIGTITNLALTEVTIDASFVSTPVVGGKCLAVGNVTLSHTAIPNAWTCAAAAYNDGTSCDCKCGLSDPDCAINNAPVVGCTGTQVCPSDACVSALANDTCQTAQALTIGTAVSGFTTGATSNYNLGLEATACTGFAQPGADVAYSVALTAGTPYTFTLSGVSAGFDPSLSLLGTGTAAAICDASPVTCLAGADASLSGAGETFSFTPTTAGTYFVIVDTFSTTGVGAFTVKVTTP